jgi:hypothetical protein
LVMGVARKTHPNTVISRLLVDAMLCSGRTFPTKGSINHFHSKSGKITTPDHESVWSNCGKQSQQSELTKAAARQLSIRRRQDAILEHAEVFRPAMADGAIEPGEGQPCRCNVAQDIHPSFPRRRVSRGQRYGLECDEDFKKIWR